MIEFRHSLNLVIKKKELCEANIVINWHYLSEVFDVIECPSYYDCSNHVTFFWCQNQLPIFIIKSLELFFATVTGLLISDCTILFYRYIYIQIYISIIRIALAMRVDSFLYTIYQSLWYLKVEYAKRCNVLSQKKISSLLT